MGVTSTSKQINLERIDCDGTLQVTQMCIRYSAW